MKVVFVAIGTYLAVYFLFALGFWVYNIYNSPLYLDSSLQHYTQKHATQLPKTITTVFMAAKKCATYTNKKSQSACEKHVSTLLAKNIIEEDFSPDPEYRDWPYDLFLVQHEGNTYFRLGWDGKIGDISKTTVPSVLSLPFTLRYLTNNCHPFAVPLLGVSDCEVFKSISLGNNQTGYLVRRVPITDEETLPFGILLLPYVGAALIIGMFYGQFSWELGNILYFSIPLLAVSISLAIAAYITYLTTKKG